MKKTCLLLALMVPMLAAAQAVRVMKPQHFKHQLPAGNYSGIAPIGDDRYAVVSDKADGDGFYVFRLRIDTVKGRIVEAVNEGYRSSGLPNRDMEGIAYRPSTGTLFISGEADNEVYEYRLDGERTGRRLLVPVELQQAVPNYGLESLAYDAQARRFYTTTEHPLPGESWLRLCSFGDDLRPGRQYIYPPDEPVSRKYIYGVAGLCAPGDGRLYVLERQVRIPRLKIGAKTVIRLYEVRPAESDTLQKRLVCEFTTRLNLLSRRFANFEGLCCPCPGWLLLVADSQDQYKGILRDWFRLVAVTKETN